MACSTCAIATGISLDTVSGCRVRVRTYLTDCVLLNFEVCLQAKLDSVNYNNPVALWRVPLCRGGMTRPALPASGIPCYGLMAERASDCFPVSTIEWCVKRKAGGTMDNSTEAARRSGGAPGTGGSDGVRVKPS